MKHLRVFVLSFLVTVLAVLALVLSSCGDDGNSTQKKTGNQGQTNTPDTPTTKYYSCSFYQDGECIGSNSLQVGTQVNEPTFSMPDNAQYHYEYIGWDANGDGQPESFPYTLNADTKFNLLYNKTPISYHYDIYVKGELVTSADAHYGDEIAYPAVESEIIDDEVYFFLGWEYDGVFDGLTYFQVSKSCRIDAHYADKQVFKYFFGGKVFANIVEAGVALPFTVTPSVETKKIVWYLDDDYTQPFTGSLMPDGNLTVWGREEYINPADAGTPVSSRAALLDKMNAMILNHVVEQKFNLQFEVTDAPTLVQGLVDDALQIYNYQVNSSYLENELTLTFTYPDIATKKSATVAYTQLASANVSSYPNSRGASYNAFAVESRENTYYVNTSDALFYALEHGYKPVIDENNTALKTLYGKMKDVLRQIIANDMTDFQKAKAIYEYLVMEVVYDANVLSLSTSKTKENVAAYNAFYLEGVFNDRLAVCDGLSKAYAALCAMEGIECVRVTGLTVEKVNHAWNKVKLGTKWYVVDVTSGGCITNSQEVLTYAYFLLSDTTYASHATADGEFFPEIACAEDYDAYSYLTVTIGGTPTLLKASSIAAAAALFTDYIGRAPAGLSSFDIQLAYDFTDTTDAVNAILSEASFKDELNYVSERNTITFIYNND